MKIGFLKWPFQGISITDSWCVHNFNILKTDQPTNNLFSHPKTNTVFAQTTLELWLRRTPYTQTKFKSVWVDFENLDCDVIIVPYTWFIFFTKEQFILLSKFQGKIVLDETVDPWIFDEVNNQEHIIPNFLKELEHLVNYENIYLLTSAKVSNMTKTFFQKKLNNVKIISSNMLMLLLTVSSLRNKQRLYSDDYIINNYNNTKDKDLLLCAGRPRYHRLALLKYLTDNDWVEQNFVSANLCPHAGDKIAPFVNKYINDMETNKGRYMLSQYCPVEDLFKYADTKIIEEYPTEYFRLDNPYPENNVYARSKCSIISETLFQTHLSGYSWITEKTCLPFIYGHPFIVFSMSGTWKYLKELGFEEYSKFGVYDSITSPYNRFTELCDQIQNLTVSPLNCKQTLEEVLYNTNHFYSENLQDSIVTSFIDQLQ